MSLLSTALEEEEESFAEDSEAPVCVRRVSETSDRSAADKTCTVDMRDSSTLLWHVNSFAHLQERLGRGGACLHGFSLGTVLVGLIPIHMNHPAMSADE